MRALIFALILLTSLSCGAQVQCRSSPAGDARCLNGQGRTAATFRSSPATRIRRADKSKITDREPARGLKAEKGQLRECVTDGRGVESCR